MKMALQNNYSNQDLVLLSKIIDVPHVEFLVVKDEEDEHDASREIDKHNHEAGQGPPSIFRNL